MVIPVSIIIPTYNRAESLRCTLAALSQQTYPEDLLEVVVVDDGSDGPLSFIYEQQVPYALRLVRQKNSGATAARNTGAEISAGKALVFLDDDIDLDPETITILVEALIAHPKTIVLGKLIPDFSYNPSTFARITAEIDREDRTQPHSIPLSECLTGILAVWREDFFSIGMFQDPTGGWPNWDDVDFGYRAHLCGYQFLRCPLAIGRHRDYSIIDLKTSCLRTERASYSAVALLNRYPELIHYLPMFQDKTSISLQDDSPRLILQKIFHSISAWGPFVWGMERLAGLLEHGFPRQAILILLYRWINSSYIYRGYHRGSNEYRTKYV